MADANLLKQAQLELAKRELARRQSTSIAQPPTGADTWLPQGITDIPRWFGKGATNFGMAAGTAIGKAGMNIAKAGAKGIGMIAGITGGQQGKDFWNKVAGTADDISSAMYDQPQFKQAEASLPGMAGKVVGTVAPYVSAATPITAGTNVASGLAAEVPGVSGAMYRTLLGATAEGAQNYILGYALSGGNKEQALAQGLTVGFLKGTTAGIGEFLKGAKVDTNLMSKIYTTDKQETERLLFGKQSKSLAEQAIDRGIKGDIRQQAVQISQGLSDSEQALMDEFAKAGNPRIQLSNPQRYITAIQDRINLLNKKGATEMAQNLETSLKNINPDGKITANAALGLRRLLDGLRQEKAFYSQTDELNAEQIGLKAMSDALRSQINSIGASGNIMKDYQFFANAKDSLVDYAKSKGSKQVFDFFGKVLLAESVFAHTPIGLGITLGRAATGFEPATSAQAISHLPESGQFGTALRSISGSVLGGFGTQKPQ